MVTCEHCKSELSNISNLTRHKSTNLKCLSIQGKNIDTIEIVMHICSSCNKNFLNKPDLLRHIKNAKSCLKYSKNIQELETKHNKNIEEININHSKNLEEQENKHIRKINKVEKQMKEQAIKYKKVIEDQVAEIDELEKQIMLLENSNVIYKKLAEKPTTSNTVNNNNKYLINTFSLMNDKERMKDIIDRELTESHVLDGQKGISKFVSDSIVKDEVGNLNYMCTDPCINLEMMMEKSKKM